MSNTSEFTTSLPIHAHFSDATNDTSHVPLPDDWLVAVTDVIKSRQAIAQGKYKAVNMAGVAMISAVMNALDHQDMPYIFGGDGAAVAFSSDDLPKVEAALAKTCRWVEEQLGLELRAACVSVTTIRNLGADIKVAGIAVSDAVTNFSFLGGGISLAEKLMKEGKHGISPAPAGDYPDLSGLSCRWAPIEPESGKIVSLIIDPPEGTETLDPETLKFLMSNDGAFSDSVSPMPKSGPGFKWPPEGLPMESRATGMSKFTLYLITLLAWILDSTGWPLGKFDPKRYRQYTALNTDYRKIQDGIRMTLMMTTDQVTNMRASLDEYQAAGKLKYGLFEQDKAVLTCFVPALTSDTHFHFLDGAGGGYAAAADELTS